MDVYWPEQFGEWLDRLESEKTGGDDRAAETLALVAAQLKLLAGMERPPSVNAETESLMVVRQSKRYLVWRVSHPYREGVAVRLICWFPPDSDVVVVAVFAADKASMGNTFYNSVGSRADAAIDQYLRETGRWADEH